MKAPSTKVRFSEASKLLDYGFANYSCKSFGNKGDLVSNAPVNKGITSHVGLLLEKDAGILLKKGSDEMIHQTVTMNENITAPIKQGDCLGKIIFTQNNEQLLEINLLAENDVAKNTLWNLTTSLYTKWFQVLR